MWTELEQGKGAKWTELKRQTDPIVSIYDAGVSYRIYVPNRFIGILQGAAFVRLMFDGDKVGVFSSPGPSEYCRVYPIRSCHRAAMITVAKSCCIPIPRGKHLVQLDDPECLFYFQIQKQQAGA